MRLQWVDTPTGGEGVNKTANDLSILVKKKNISKM